MDKKRLDKRFVGNRDSFFLLTLVNPSKGFGILIRDEARVMIESI